MLKVEDLSSKHTTIQVNQTQVISGGFDSFLAFPGLSLDSTQTATPFGVILDSEGLVGMTLGGSSFGASQFSNSKIPIPWPMNEFDPTIHDTGTGDDGYDGLSGAMKGLTGLIALAAIIGLPILGFCCYSLSRKLIHRRKRIWVRTVEEGKIELREGNKSGAEGEGESTQRGGVLNEDDLPPKIKVGDGEYPANDVFLEDLTPRQ